MHKYGWEWKSADAAEAYKRILMEMASHGGGFGGREGLDNFIKLADLVVQTEGRVPRSFIVAVDLGHIYSTGAALNAKNAATSEALANKAKAAWDIASTFVTESGEPTEPEVRDDGALRRSYMSRYWEIPCELGFAKYVTSDLKERSFLDDIIPLWGTRNAKEAKVGFWMSSART